MNLFSYLQIFILHHSKNFYYLCIPKHIIKKHPNIMTCNSLDEVRANIDRIDTTPMGANRIRRNINLTDNEDVVNYCKNKILAPGCKIYKDGKNWYCEIDGIRITVNSHSLTIITAHKM